MISVVIQGPVDSGGKNCIDEILQNLDAFTKSPLVDMVVLSTWDDQGVDAIKGRLPIIRSPGITYKDPLNRSKQMLSTAVGAEYAKANTNSSWVLKIRTDQVVPITVLDEIMRLSEYPRNGILKYPLLFAYINRTIPFHIGDYYFGGHIDDVIGFCRTNLSFGSWYFQYGVELDIVLKYLIGNDPDFPLTDAQLLSHMCIAGKYPQGHPIWNAWHSYYKAYFVPSAEDTFRNVEWKGQNIIAEANRRQIYGNTERADTVFRRYIDFYHHWEMLNADYAAYCALEKDTQFGGIRYLHDLRAFLRQYMRYKAKKAGRIVSRLAHGAFASLASISGGSARILKRIIRRVRRIRCR